MWHLRIQRNSDHPSAFCQHGLCVLLSQEHWLRTCYSRCPPAVFVQSDNYKITSRQRQENQGGEALNKNHTCWQSRSPSALCTARSTQVAELATGLGARGLSDTKAALGVHLYSLDANKGLKVTLGIVCVQKFQSDRSKPAFWLNFRKSSSCKNMVWTECKGLRGARGRGWLRGWLG